MEESIDGTHISATWLGDVVEGSCGREIRGTWQAEKRPARPTLRTEEAVGRSAAPSGGRYIVSERIFQPSPWRIQYCCFTSRGFRP